MTNPNLLICDGCGQAADSAHIAKRLQRLEWTTRFRPVHIHTLLLSGFSPAAEDEFLYSPRGEFRGEALNVLEAAGVSPVGKTRAAAHVEFQRGGFFLTHALECPPEFSPSREEVWNRLLQQRVLQAAARIRRSLKPKRVILITESLDRVVGQLSETLLGCAVVLDGKTPFGLDGTQQAEAIQRLRHVIFASAGAAR